jgi:hypothetical protein
MRTFVSNEMMRRINEQTFAVDDTVGSTASIYCVCDSGAYISNGQ